MQPTKASGDSPRDCVYKRVAEVDGKEVPWDQIVKGYEHERGKFVVLKDEDFKRVVSRLRRPSI